MIRRFWLTEVTASPMNLGKRGQGNVDFLNQIEIGFTPVRPQNCAPRPRPKNPHILLRFLRFCPPIKILYFLNQISQIAPLRCLTSRPSTNPAKGQSNYGRKSGPIMHARFFPRCSCSRSPVRIFPDEKWPTIPA